MKKVLIAILMIIALVLCVSSASAAINADTLTIGDSNTDAANSEGDDGDGVDSHKPATLTLTSSGAGAITGLTCVVESVEDGYRNINSADDNDWEDDLDITITVPTDTIPDNGSVDVTVNARIVSKLDAVNSDGEAGAFKVATIKCSGTEGGSPIEKLVDVKMQRENMLTLEDVRITSDEHDESSYDMSDDGDTVDEIKPEETVTVEIEAENQYNDEDDVEIDTEVAIEIDEGEMDVSEDEDIGDIDTEESDSATLEFDVEDDASGEYTAYITVIGEDDHGARHGERLELEFDVERKKYEFVIKDADLDYSEVSCSRGNTIKVKIASLGTRGDDEVFLYIENRALGIDFVKEDLELDDYDGSDDTYTKTLMFTVPSNLAAGSYPISVSLYYSGDEDDGVHADEKDVVLTVRNCGGTTTTDEIDMPDNVEITDSGQIEVTVPENVLQEFGIVETVDEGESFTDSTAFIVLLAILVIAVLGGEVALIVLLAKK
ncbi:hypothetical protein KY332_01665 [Candidatus Woesearchaeota archaeon]|nr:hypothetical protein [Candidatus Woesearchaeota archaeon]